MARGHRLTGGSGRGFCSGIVHFTGPDAADKPPTNLFAGAQLSSGERPGPRDEGARAVVVRSLDFEETKDPLCAVGSPFCDATSVGFTKRLRGLHRRP
jgi:hypothetical protein